MPDNQQTDIDYQCRDCAAKFAAPSEASERLLFKCPKCKGDSWGVIPEKPPTVLFNSADFNWHTENGGRGRHISQLELPLEEKVDAGLDIKKNDPFAYCRSRNEIVDKAARRGKRIVSGAPRSARTIKK